METYNIFQSLESISGCIFFAVDKEYRYIAYSLEYAEFVERRWDRKVEHGVSIFETVGNDLEKAVVKTNFDRVLFEGEEFTSEEPYGDTRLWKNSYKPILDGNADIVGVLVFVVKTTEQPERGEQFHRLKIFESIVNQVNAGVTLADPEEEDTPLVFVNDAFTRITGYEKEEVLGKNCRFLQGEETDDKNLEAIREAIRNRKSCEVILTNYRKDGTKFLNLLNISPIFDEKGSLIYFAGIQDDITDKIEQQKLEALQNIAAGLSHEINTSLASLSENIELLEYNIESCGTTSAESELFSSLEEIRKSKKTIRKVVDTLHFLNASSSETGESFNLYETLRNALIFFDNKIAAGGIIATIDGQDWEEVEGEIAFIGERKSITHLWMILLENAIDALAEKEEGTKELRISVAQERGLITVSIVDNGIGIDPDIVGDLFKPLIKHKHYRGIGLGLNTAKTIVENHKGAINFQTDHTGTVFTVTFAY